MTDVSSATTPPPGDRVRAAEGSGGSDKILHQPPVIDADDLYDVSPRLYNGDLAPTKKAGRPWSGYNIFTLWANDVHSLGNYSFAIGLFALGLGGWQILVSLGLGAVLLFALLTLSGLMGLKTGVPFPVMSRIAFGIHGAQLSALLRGAVAVVWFGIQTYLASVVFRVALIAVFPSLASLDTGSFLGLSALGWITFLALWALQLYIVSHGLETVRHYEAFAGPVILVTLAALSIWVFLEAGATISFPDDRLTGGEMWSTIFAGAGLWVAIYGTFVLNFCDFTRAAASRKAVIGGNFWGIPINMLLFGAIVVVLSGAQFAVDGTVIASPADVVETIPSTILLVAASLALLVLTIAVNLMANFVAPIYALANLAPKHLDFKRAALISAIIGLVILPWNLYNSPAVIVYFLGGLGALLGPLFGVIMADYWILRKARIDVPALFTENPDGVYHYRNGVNPRAILAFAIAAVLALLVAFLPAWAGFAGLSWFFGAGGGAIAYLLVAKRGDRQRELADVSGEDIAVAATH